MKAEGSAKDLDADHVRKECLMSKDVGVVELITPEVSDQKQRDRRPNAPNETSYSKAFITMCTIKLATK